MKKVFLAAAVMAALASGSVMADTITINGEVIENGCTVGDNGNADITLNKITVQQAKAATIGAHLGDMASSFKLSSCPAYDINIQFVADTVATDANAIVNTEAPSNTVIAHHLYNEANTESLNGTTQTIANGTPEADSAQSANGYYFPINVGYTKIAEVDDQSSPAGITKSVVTMNITYAQ
ncbi:fimbrial protein [Citrobacter sp. U14242]|uniref:fimbrial protein n=1 Tax=Citrobacter sp. U14242 TaxID=3390192 RepID=UPI00397BBBCA